MVSGRLGRVSVGSALSVLTNAKVVERHHVTSLVFKWVLVGFSGG